LILEEISKYLEIRFDRIWFRKNISKEIKNFRQENEKRKLEEK